jgi:outer membrane protein assembly factor BamB
MWARSLAAATDQFVDVDATPAFFGDQVVASSYSGGLYALSTRKGEVRWRIGIEGASALRIDAGRLYVAAPREGLAALTPEGQFLWRQGLAEAGDLTPPTAVGPYLIFSGSRAGLFIVERSTGRLLQLFNPGHGACAAPAIGPDGHDLYLLANSGSVYALRLTY